MSPDEAALADIIVRARRIAELVARHDEASFLADPDAQDALQYRLLIIGEAVKRLSQEFRDSHPDVTWSEVAGLRDVLAHSYHRVSLRRLWQFAAWDVPQLLAFVEPLVPPPA
jgi:uncharacterized protein with HEPN domain